ncbi:FkbM family methyltransferase [Salinibacter ruber]|nr:FkbM family methyltransferase [Salinibacter ruber]
MSLILRVVRGISFRGKGKLQNFLLSFVDDDSYRIRKLPKGGKLMCNISIPYEAMVWLRQEEQKELEVLRTLLSPGDVFVDCGANIGLWSIVAAEEVGSEGVVYSFEPNPNTYRKMLGNMAISNIVKVETENVALGESNSSAFIKCKTEHNDSYLNNSGESQNDVKIPIRKLDSLVSKERVKGMKVDVEGYELEVLKGAEDILRSDEPWLFVEFNTQITGVTRLKNWAVHTYLADLGYEARSFQDLTLSGRLHGEWSTSGYCNILYLKEGSNAVI